VVVKEIKYEKQEKEIRTVSKRAWERIVGQMKRTKMVTDG
jgi:hypothetical protein